MEQDYDEALQIFNRLNIEYPELPLGKIYSAAVYITRAEDYGKEFDRSQIEVYLNQAEQQSAVLFEKNNNLWNQYFLALSKGYLAYYHLLNKDYLSALSDGLKSIKLFEKSIEIDSSFFEAYIAIGSYKYWKSEKTEFLNWLPFVSDERQLGIKTLKKGLEIPTYNHFLGVNSLVWIYINLGKYTNAINLCNEVLKKYPSNRTFKRSLGSAYARINIKKAISIYYELLKSYTEIKGNNHYYEIVIKYIIAKQYVKIGDVKSALKLCNDILSIKDLDNYVAKKTKERLEKVRTLQRELILKENK